MFKKFIRLAEISLLALISAINYCIFVFPNKFAPAGIDGICTMIQDVLNINMGYLSLVVNIPLVIIAFIMLNRDFAIKSSIYVIVFSVSVIIIKELDISKLYYFTETGTSTVLAPIASGVIRGIIYAYISSYTCNHLRNKEHENIKYEIITKAPTKITSYINQQLHQKATIINAKGAFSDEDTSVILCIVEKSYAPFLEKFLLDFPNCITFKSYASDSISGITYK